MLFTDILSGYKKYLTNILSGYKQYSKIYYLDIEGTSQVDYLDICKKYLTGRAPRRSEGHKAAFLSKS